MNKDRLNAVLITTKFIWLLFLLGTAQSVLPQMPGLYLDRFTPWNANGTANGPTPGGHNFTLTWRSTLPSVLSASLTLYNFKTAPNSILSFRTSFSSVNTTSAVVNLNPVGSQSLLTYISFSVIVITQDTNSIEILTVEASNITVTSSNNYAINVLSNKFNLSGSNYNLNHFFEWITGEMQSDSASYNYWSYAYAKVVPETNQVKVSFWTSYLVYMTGFKVNLVLVAKNTGNNTVVRHYNRTQYVQYFPLTFTYNLGIDQTLFGAQNGGYCFHGLHVLDFYVYSPSSKYASVIFIFNSSNITNVEYSSAYSFKIDTICYGTCPTAYLYNGTCMLCRSTIPFCLECLTDKLCKTCMTEFILSADNTTCNCPARKYGNVSTLKCLVCPYDCYTCDPSTLLCLNCNATTDFRVLNAASGRCIPMVGYYQSNVTVSAQCHSSCMVCNSSAQCEPCPVRQYRNYSTYACDSCPFDCYICHPFTFICLSCNSSTDRRALNSTAGRCQPISGYFQSNTTVAGQCSLGCISCSNANTCSNCSVRYFLNLTAAWCQACVYDCYTCNGVGSCLSCNGSTDYRYISGVRCAPMVGYFQSNVTVAGKCSDGCDRCLSTTQCTQCNSSLYLFSSQCISSCPARYYPYTSNRTCLSCPYDCYTCSSTGQCSSCASSDNRQLDTTTNRCIPVVGFYEIQSSSVCLPCNASCSQCQSLLICTGCVSGYVLEGSVCKAESGSGHTDPGSSGTTPAQSLTNAISSQNGSGSEVVWIVMGSVLGLVAVCFFISLGIFLFKKYSNNGVQADNDDVPIRHSIYRVPDRIRRADASRADLIDDLAHLPDISVVRPPAGRIVNLRVRPMVIRPAAPLPPPPVPRRILVGIWAQQPIPLPPPGDSNICSICLDEQPNLMTSCRHWFNHNCIDMWFLRNGHFQCPNCKRRIGQTEHRLLCRECKTSNRKITRVQLRMLIAAGGGASRWELLCDNCREYEQI